MSWRYKKEKGEGWEEAFTRKKFAKNKCLYLCEYAILFFLFFCLHVS